MSILSFAQHLVVELGICQNRLCRTTKTHLGFPDPDDVSHHCQPMTLLATLQDFLAGLGSPDRSFLLGDWLQSLDDDGFTELRWKFDKSKQGDDSNVVQEIFTLVIALMEAEVAKPTFSYQESDVPRWMDTLSVALSIETFRRKGWVKMIAPLSIRPEVRVSLEITAAGRRDGPKMMNTRH